MNGECLALASYLTSLMHRLCFHDRLLGRAEVAVAENDRNRRPHSSAFSQRKRVTAVARLWLGSTVRGMVMVVTVQQVKNLKLRFLSCFPLFIQRRLRCALSLLSTVAVEMGNAVATVVPEPQCASSLPPSSGGGGDGSPRPVPVAPVTLRQGDYALSYDIGHHCGIGKKRPDDFTLYNILTAEQVTQLTIFCPHGTE